MKVSIDKLVDASVCPAIAECSLHDIWNGEHIFVEKLPIVSRIDVIFDYPQPGFIRCELIKTWQDCTGRKIVTVTTQEPDFVETINGITHFDLLESQVQDYVK